jgi:hypothetical protein
MPKKKTVKKLPAKKAAGRMSEGCAQLLIVDNAPLLKGHRERYQRVLKDVQKAEQDLLRHQSEDGPEFDRWYHSTFGEQLTALRRGEEEMHSCARILIEVDQLVMRDRCPDYIAYHRVKLREQGLPDPYEKPPEAARATVRDEEEDAEQAGNFDSFEAEADFIADMLKAQAKAYQKKHGQLPPGYEEIMRELGRGSEAPPPPPSNHKQIYRQIVTRLHPDRGERFSPVEQALWHEAQAAYRAGDTVALEVILARCEAAQDGVEITRMSLIVGMIAQARANLSQLRERLRDFKRHPSWGFVALKNKMLLKKRIMAEFRLDLEDQEWRLRSIRMDLESLEKRYERWLAKEEKRKKNSEQAKIAAEIKATEKRERLRKAGQGEFW